VSRRPRARAEETPQTTPGFDVHLENFEGPFDLLLQLISRRELDVTRVALSQVTDEFIAHVRAAGDALGLEQTSSFLVVAATLLDLKAARLLPRVIRGAPWTRCCAGAWHGGWRSARSSASFWRR